VKIALGPPSSYTAARPMPEPGRGEMNFRADGAIYVRIAARNREVPRARAMDDTVGGAARDSRTPVHDARQGVT
jgi:hypothetical protein